MFGSWELLSSELISYHYERLTVLDALNVEMLHIISLKKGYDSTIFLKIEKRSRTQPLVK